MKRVTFGILAALVLMGGSNDGVVAGSKWKPWKKSDGTCAAPMTGCYGPATCFEPVCSQPSCYQPQCGAPTCFDPGCGMPLSCGMPSCAAPWFGATLGCAGCGGCSGIMWGDAMLAGPTVGGMPMTPPYYAPVAPVTFTVPAIPPVEDLAW
jgi:hypothetical protein